ncbi:hypothetical protein HFU84_07940 [Acidithiobacillus sp. CV18-2]|nr:hypothetical protein [Acidithiobacillus sp. CV18-3]MBU2758129.1 hypothetical protein [Acidithiobacillus sp. BN09-2]MBU2777434.1 hypothetical protein [Acidithiobacillus sp. CV18-2]MBU2800171.1 hypothetical protein [Acidithiobacillus sp. VAN18-4]
MSKLAVVLLSDLSDPVKVEMAILFTLVAKREQILDDVRFYLFGPGVRVPGQITQREEPLKQHFDDLLASGVATIACIYNPRALGEEAHLQAAELEARAIGPELTRLIVEGYQIMTF